MYKTKIKNESDERLTGRREIKRGRREKEKDTGRERQNEVRRRER